MSIPCGSDNITFDADAFINYALLFGPIESFFAKPLHDLIKNCKEQNITVGYFESIKQQSYRNITKAVIQFAKSKGKYNYYEWMKYKDQGMGHLDKMFSQLNLFIEIFSDPEIITMRQFFVDNVVDVKQKLNLQHNKPNIPEDHDLKLLVCCNNSTCSKMFLVSNDGHFIAYAEAISSKYKVAILPMQDVRLKMIEWKWT